MRAGNKVRVIGSVIAILIAVLIAAPVWASEGKLVHVVRFADYELGLCPVSAYWTD